MNIGIRLAITELNVHSSLELTVLRYSFEEM